MKRTLLVLGILALLTTTFGCNHQFLPPTPPSKPTPTSTPTATPTLGCLTSGQWTLMGLVVPATPVVGVIPANTSGNFVIRNQADWDAYVAGSSQPGLVEPLPFDPATRMLLVVGNAKAMCARQSEFQQVCYETNQVTVTATTTQICCGNPPGFPNNGIGSLCISVPRSDLPVVWNYTYIPLPPDYYLYCM